MTTTPFPSLSFICRDPITRIPFQGPAPLDWRHTGHHIWLCHGYETRTADPPGVSASSGELPTDIKAHLAQHPVQSPPLASVRKGSSYASSAWLPKLPPVPPLRPTLLMQGPLLPVPHVVWVEQQGRGGGGVAKAAPEMEGFAEALRVGSRAGGAQVAGMGHHAVGGARGYLASLARAEWDFQPITEKGQRNEARAKPMDNTPKQSTRQINRGGG